MMGARQYFVGRNYVPTRQEIRRWLDIARDHAADLVADGVIAAERAERWAWGWAVDQARIVTSFKNLPGRWLPS